MRQCEACGHWELDPAKQATLEFIRGRESIWVTSTEVALHFGVTLPNANNRLRALVTAGKLERYKVPPDGGVGGVQYVYWIPRA